MNDEQRQAFKWALNQEYQSVAARYARTLALYVAEHTGDIEAIQGIEALYPNWRGKFTTLVEAIKWHTDGQDKVIANLRSQIDNKEKTE